MKAKIITGTATYVERTLNEWIDYMTNAFPNLTITHVAQSKLGDVSIAITIFYTF